MIIFGLKLFAWGNSLTPQSMNCGNCGQIAPFIQKKTMRFITIWFVIPVIPVSGVKNVLECPNCKARYEA